MSASSIILYHPHAPQKAICLTETLDVKTLQPAFPGTISLINLQTLREFFPGEQLLPGRYQLQGEYTPEQLVALDKRAQRLQTLLQMQPQQDTAFKRTFRPTAAFLSSTPSAAAAAAKRLAESVTPNDDAAAGAAPAPKSLRSSSSYLSETERAVLLSRFPTESSFITYLNGLCSRCPGTAQALPTNVSCAFCASKPPRASSCDSKCPWRVHGGASAADLPLLASETFHAAPLVILAHFNICTRADIDALLDRNLQERIKHAFKQKKRFEYVSYAWILNRLESLDSDETVQTANF